MRIRGLDGQGGGRVGGLSRPDDGRRSGKKASSRGILRFRRRRNSALEMSDSFSMAVRLFGYLIRDGYTPAAAVESIARQTKEELGDAMGAVARNIRTGDSISDAIRKTDFFPSEFSGIVLAGEKSGKLPEALDSYSFYLDKVINMKKSFTAALRYPSFMLSFVSCMGIFLLVGITPKIIEMAESMNVSVASLPPASRALFAFYSGVSSFGTVIPIGIALLFAYYMFLGRGRAHIIAAISFIPQVREINHKLSWSQWLLLMSICIKSGLSIPDSILSSSENRPREMRGEGVMDDMLDSLRAGQSLSVEMEQVGAPDTISEMVGISERTGRVDDVMDSLAKQYLFQLEFEIRSVAAVIEPIVIAVATGIGAGIAGVVATTIMSISGAVQG